MQRFCPATVLIVFCTTSFLSQEGSAIPLHEEDVGAFKGDFFRSLRGNVDIQVGPKNGGSQTPPPTEHPTRATESPTTPNPSRPPTPVPSPAPIEVEVACTKCQDGETEFCKFCTTSSPTVPPTAMPTPSPTPAPTLAPSALPTVTPTPSPTNTPTLPPTHHPTLEPTRGPTGWPSHSPTPSPSPTPTYVPTPRYAIMLSILFFVDSSRPMTRFAAVQLLHQLHHQLHHLHTCRHPLQLPCRHHHHQRIQRLNPRRCPHGCQPLHQHLHRVKYPHEHQRSGHRYCQVPIPQHGQQCHQRSSRRIFHRQCRRWHLVSLVLCQKDHALRASTLQKCITQVHAHRSRGKGGVAIQA